MTQVRCVRRIRPDGNARYRRAEGEFVYCAADPHADPDFTREPLRDRVEVVLIGAGFGGLLTGARLRQAGVEDIRVTAEEDLVADGWTGSARLLRHGFTSHDFPDLVHLGPLQNASAVNFVHVLDEQAIHVAAILAEARARRSHHVEPTPEAEAARVAEIRENAGPDGRLPVAQFLAGRISCGPRDRRRRSA